MSEGIGTVGQVVALGRVVADVDRFHRISQLVALVPRVQLLQKSTRNNLSLRPQPDRTCLDRFYPS